MSSLPGTLTKTAGFPGASCDLGRPNDVLRRINGEAIPEVATAEGLLGQLQEAVIALLHLMDWKDFELLIDLIFSTSGWRRQGDVGGDQATADIELELPSTGERALVQIKSASTQSELDGSYNPNTWIQSWSATTKIGCSQAKRSVTDLPTATAEQWAEFLSWPKRAELHAQEYQL